MTIRSAVILAAGLGTRMRPITLTTPKPLVKVAGKALIDYSIDSLIEAGVSHAAVNLHYLADQVQTHCSARTDLHIEFSDERAKLLDSGGGVKQALQHMPPGPFFILNADTFWLDDPTKSKSNLRAMSDRFDPNEMDMLLMLAIPEQATGHDGAGDFVCDGDGRLARYENKERPYIYAGAIAISPRVFKDCGAEPFSLNKLFDQAIQSGRLFGHIMHGHWITVGTPEAIPPAEKIVSRMHFLSSIEPETTQ